MGNPNTNQIRSSLNPDALTPIRSNHSMAYRVILYHKHPTSARTTFLKFAYHSICAFEKLPSLAQVVDYHADTLLHPATVLSEVEKKLGFAPDLLKAEGEFLHTVEAPGEKIQIILAAITSMDAPYDIAEQNQAQFIALTQARGLPDVELELLRHAYELVLGG